jgi:hypothetical protein
MLNTLPGIAAACLMFFSRNANSYEMVIAGRFLVGFNCGNYWAATFYIIVNYIQFHSICRFVLNGIVLVGKWFDVIQWKKQTNTTLSEHFQNPIGKS